MSNRVLPALAVIALLNATGFAAAADLIEPAYEEVPQAAPSTAGWYLRGDVGVVLKSKTTGDYSFYNQFEGVEGVDDIFQYDRLETKSAASFGAGVGYRFTDMFRADVTLDHFKADVRGSTSCISYVTASKGLGFYNDCGFDDRSEVSVWTAMANAYVDIGHFGIVTPYIGAGLGGARVKYDEVKSTEVCGSDPACTGIDPTFDHPGESSWRFAAALMAGATIDLTSRLKLDAGYRYTRIANGDYFGYDSADRSFGAKGVQARDDGFDIHTIRAGLRYEFGGGVGLN